MAIELNHTFGMSEMENAAVKILEHLAPKKSWSQSLHIDGFQIPVGDFHGKDYSAKRTEYGLYQLMLNGWLRTSPVGKAWFCVSEEFIERVHTNPYGKQYTEGWEEFSWDVIWDDCD